MDDTSWNIVFFDEYVDIYFFPSNSCLWFLSDSPLPYSLVQAWVGGPPQLKYDRFDALERYPFPGGDAFSFSPPLVLSFSPLKPELGPSFIHVLHVRGFSRAAGDLAGV